MIQVIVMCLVSLDSTETIQQKLLSCVLCYTYSFYIDLAMTYIRIRGISHSVIRQIPLMLILFPSVDMIGCNIPSLTSHHNKFLPLTPDRPNLHMAGVLVITIIFSLLCVHRSRTHTMWSYSVSVIVGEVRENF